LLKNNKGGKSLSPESALKLDPECHYCDESSQDIFGRLKRVAHFKYTTAVKNKAVLTIDGSYLLGSGPRTPQAIVEWGTMIHKTFLYLQGYKFFRYQGMTSASMAEH